MISGIWLLKCSILLPTNIEKRKREYRETCDTSSSKRTNIQTKDLIQHDDLELCNVDYVSSNVKSSHFGAMPFEDNEAVIKIIIEGRSPTMRHVSRTHRVALHWLFDRSNMDPKIEIKNVDTKNQLAHMLTKGCFTRDEWDHLLRLLNSMNFSMSSCSQFLSNRKQSVMSKRAQESTSEERSAI